MAHRNVEEILASLTESQKKIVQAINGKYLVLASAGSGKTKSLTSRIEYLLAIGVKPWEIVGISFTKKASNEIKERIQAVIGEDALELVLGTFHSICMRILLANQHLLGLPSITVLDEDESAKIISELAATHGFIGKDAANDIKRTIGRWSNECLTPQEVRETNLYPNVVVDIYEEYNHFKKNVGYVDFNDILMLTAFLFDKFPDVREKYAGQYKYVMIDECQDSNKTQTKLMYQFSSVHHNFMVFGDDYQAVYGFRGGDVHNFMAISNNDPEVKVMKLERNFRSTQNIVNASNAVIKHNKKQMQKTSYSENKKGTPIFVYRATDESREADFVIEVIEGMVKTGNYAYSDFMVLYRQHSLSRTIEFTFSRLGMPYEIIGGKEFYEREEIKTLVSYLRVMANPLDDLAFERIINKPKRGIGDATIDRIKVFATGAEISFFSAMEHIEDIPKINKKTKAEIKNFVEFIKEGQVIVNKENTSIKEILLYILSKTEFLSQYDKDKTKDIAKMDNINELFNMTVMFDEKDKIALEENQTLLNQFLTETALYIPEEMADARDKVAMLTVHASKGLESKIVFIIGLEEGTFPSRMANSEDEMSEERRLFYVGMTRAAEMLYLSYNGTRYIRGQMMNCEPSRFISQIPSEHMHFLGIDNNNNSDGLFAM